MTHTELAPTDGFALLSATASADTNEVRRLLSEVPPSMRAQLVNFADYDGRRPLHVACSLGHTAVARELLRSGADWRCKDRFGRSCVHEAVASGRLPVLRALAAWNGDAARAVKHPVDVFGDGLPAACVEPSYCWGRDLLCAVATGNIRAVRQLVRQFGANVNFANADGRTALHIAAVRDDAQMVMYLLEAGADASRRDRWGITPREEARRCGFEKLASVFASLNKS